jgi:hypothetical protein
MEPCVNVLPLQESVWARSETNVRNLTLERTQQKFSTDEPCASRLGARRRTRRATYNKIISFCDSFRYLGTQITPDHEESSDIDTGLVAATETFMATKDVSSANYKSEDSQAI